MFQALSLPNSAWLSSRALPQPPPETPDNIIVSGQRPSVWPATLLTNAWSPWRFFNHAAMGVVRDNADATDEAVNVALPSSGSGSRPSSPSERDRLK